MNFANTTKIYHGKEEKEGYYLNNNYSNVTFKPSQSNIEKNIYFELSNPNYNSILDKGIGSDLDMSGNNGDVYASFGLNIVNLTENNDISLNDGVSGKSRLYIDYGGFSTTKSNTFGYNKFAYNENDFVYNKNNNKNDYLDNNIILDMFYRISNITNYPIVTKTNNNL